MDRTNRIVVNEGDLWAMLDAECTDRSYSESQGDDHSEVDMRLVAKIADLLHPQIGDWEESIDWHHNLDFHGDGIRSLIFNSSTFRPEFIQSLQAVLVDEHEPFCILCQLFEDIESEEDTRVGSIAIFCDRILISRSLANHLARIEQNE